MSYQLAIWLNFAVWAAISAVFFIGNSKFEYVTRWFLRSNSAMYIFFGTAGVIVLYNIYHLSPADFGQYKTIIFVIFSLGILGAIAKVRDFLSVRGLAALLLLIANCSLRSVFTEHLIWRHGFVVLQYLIIIFAMYIGVYPYVLRNLRDLCLRNVYIKMYCAVVCCIICSFLLGFWLFN